MKAESTLREYFTAYRAGAHKRDHGFYLTYEEFIDLITKPCIYCGLEPKTVKRKTHVTYVVFSGIDRVDSAKDYIMSNVVPCCAMCSRKKGRTNHREFLDWVNRIAAYRGQKAPL